MKKTIALVLVFTLGLVAETREGCDSWLWRHHSATPRSGGSSGTGSLLRRGLRSLVSCCAT